MYKKWEVAFKHNYTNTITLGTKLSSFVILCSSKTMSQSPFALLEITKDPKDLKFVCYKIYHIEKLKLTNF